MPDCELARGRRHDPPVSRVSNRSGSAYSQSAQAMGPQLTVRVADHRVNHAPYRTVSPYPRWIVIRFRSTTFLANAAVISGEVAE